VKEAQVDEDDDGLKTVTLGEDGTVEVEYLYTITNTGDTVLELTSLSDDRIDELDVSFADDQTLEPGESTTATITTTLSSEDFGQNGEHVNVAVVAAEGPDDEEVTGSDEETVYEVVVERRQIEQVVEPRVVEPEPETEVRGVTLEADAEQLPRTGANTLETLLVALVMLLLGAGLLRSRQRRSGPN
jgi:LPXTG-motif cell wall-anchored protein